jgi:non-canonical purine NTP pyrophosphatase (RdgB/HAM1 family)
MKVSEIILVSGNKAKATEVERILNVPIKNVALDLPEIQSMDLEAIIFHKLDQAFKAVKKPVLVDDVSFEVSVWGGFPGPFIKWLLQEKNDPSLMLKMLGDEKNREATARLAVGFHDGKSPRAFFGEVTGTVSHEIRGDNGFGWDKVFIPNGYDLTFAQMSPELKDSMSHRGKALKKLSDFIKSNYEI